MSQMLKVISCPDRLELAHALLNGDETTKKAVSFRVQPDPKSGTLWEEQIKVSSIEREDGSGDCFTVYGFNVANSAKVRVHFSIERNEGMMIFI